MSFLVRLWNTGQASATGRESKRLPDVPLEHGRRLTHKPQSCHIVAGNHILHFETSERTTSLIGYKGDRLELNWEAFATPRFGHWGTWKYLILVFYSGHWPTHWTDYRILVPVSYWCAYLTLPFCHKILPNHDPNVLDQLDSLIPYKATVRQY